MKSTTSAGFRTVVVAGVCGVALVALAIRTSAQRGASTPPARGASAPAQPTGPMPKMTVGGIRVTAPGIGDKGTELRPFNEYAGTALVIYLEAPPGAGMIDIDDDASSVKSFADDKGTNMLEEGRIGPFPKVSDDGMAGLFEIEVRARPSAGATSVNVVGTVAVTLASGSKPTKVPSVRLEKDRTFKVGATTVTVKDVKVNEDDTELELGLPRSAMGGIRAVKFTTAAGAEIEARRTGSGYMNDAGEFDFTVKTKEKIVNLEFELWQNVRVVKVPFNVKASLSLER